MTTLRPNRIDLHCHTSRSDGLRPPLELYQEMRRFGMELVAVTDHDTLDGYRELRSAGLGAAPSPQGPLLLPGVEINSIPNGAWRERGLGRTEGELHILGLGFDADDERFEAVLARQRAGRAARVEETLRCLRRIGKPVDAYIDGALPAGTSAGRPHIARAMIAAGYVASVEEAFTEYLSRDRPCYVPRLGLGPIEAIQAIRAAGGLTVLAHARHAPNHPTDVGELQEAGLDGLEVYHSSFDAETVTVMRRFAEERGLVPTGGSDYHGDTMSYAEAQSFTYVPASVGERVLAAVGRATAVTSTR